MFLPEAIMVWKFTSCWSWRHWLVTASRCCSHWLSKSEIPGALLWLIQLSLAMIRRSIPISSDSEIKEFLAKELINFAASASKPQSLLLRMLPRWFHSLQFCVDSLPQMWYLLAPVFSCECSEGGFTFWSFVLTPCHRYDTCRHESDTRWELCEP